MKQKTIVYLGNKLSSKGMSVTSVETLGNFLIKEGYVVYRASSFKNKYLRLFDMLWCTLMHARKAAVVLIDTYSTQNFYYAVVVATFCRVLKVPYIPILHGGNLPERLEKSPKLSKRLFGRAKINVAPSQYLMKAFKKKGYHNITHIPNTLALKNYPFQKRSISTPKLLWVRSFAKIYNPLMAIRVFENIKKCFPEASLCMVGPDKDGTLEICKAYAQKHALEVRFTGKLSKRDWIQLSGAYNIFMNTTHFDNTPVSVMEAMALGLPVVSTDVGGIPFLLAHHKDALLLGDNDLEGFVQAITHLCENPLLVEALTANARAKVAGFDWDQVKHLWHKLLQD